MNNLSYQRFQNNNKPKIALEGPINGCDDNECMTWREKVIKALYKKFNFHDPMVFDCRGKEVEFEQQLVDYDTAGIASSHILLVMAHYPSWGTAMAVQMGWAMHKYIVVICNAEKISPWLNNRASVVVPNEDEAIEMLSTREQLLSIK